MVTSPDRIPRTPTRVRRTVGGIGKSFVPYTGAIKDVDLGAFNLTTTGLGTFGNLDVDTLNLNANIISDSTGTISFDNDNLVTTGTGRFDGGLIDSSDNVIVDIEVGRLQLVDLTEVVDWFLLILNDTSENLSIAWGNRQLIDSANNPTINWGNQQLISPNADIILDWSVDNLADFKNNAVTTTGTITAGSGGFIVGTLTITDGTIDDTDGAITFGDTNLTTTGLITTGNLDVDTLNLNANVISDSTGTISFDNDDLTTTGRMGIGTSSFDIYRKLVVQDSSHTYFDVKTTGNAQTGFNLKRDQSGGSYNCTWFTYINYNSTDLSWYNSGDKMALTAAGNLSTVGSGTFIGAIIGDGGATNYLGISAMGDIIFHGSGGMVFGGCYGNHIGWSQANAVQDTWYNIADADMISGQLNGVTHDGNGKLTVTEPGMYIVAYSICFEDNAANDHVEAGIEVNGSGSANAAGQAHLENKFASEEEHMGSSCILDLTDNATLEVAIRTTDAGTPTISVQAVNLTCIQVGGT